MISPGSIALCCGLAALSPQQERGRQIYHSGSAADQSPILVVLSEAAAPISASLMPCVNCHGSDGRGLREGGLKPADITAPTLARSLANPERTRPAYTPALLNRAITMGFDSAGNRLDRSMPRFQMSRQNADDLLAYLAVVGHDAQPGLSDDAIYIDLIGTPLISAPEAPIYGRRITLRDSYGADALLRIDVSDNGDASLAAAERDQIPTIVYRANQASPGAFGYVLTAAETELGGALRAYAQTLGAESVLYQNDCAGIEHVDAANLVLMTAAAARECDLSQVPLALDHRLIIATSVPPEPPNRQAIASFVLALVKEILANAGSDPSRTALRDALETVYQLQAPALPTITWSPNNHYGSRSAWLMTLDLPQQRLLAEPGWVEAPHSE